jgi:hypothetical protein
MSVELIVQLLHCLSAFCEENNGCLEGMLRIGARLKVIQLLSNEHFFHLSVLRSGLGCLAVLCGYTHVFEAIPAAVGNENTTLVDAISIPSALQFEERELFDLLSLVSNLLSRFISMSSAVSDFDPIVTLNFGIICRYLLPLCPQQDPLYQVHLLLSSPPLNFAYRLSLLSLSRASSTISSISSISHGLSPISITSMLSSPWTPASWNSWSPPETSASISGTQPT